MRACVRYNVPGARAHRRDSPGSSIHVPIKSSILCCYGVERIEVGFSNAHSIIAATGMCGYSESGIAIFLLRVHNVFRVFLDRRTHRLLALQLQQSQNITDSISISITFVYAGSQRAI